MNTLMFYPKKLRKTYISNIRNSGVQSSPAKYHNSIFLFSIIVAVLASTLFYFFNVKMYWAIVVLLFLLIFSYFRISLKASARIKKMEDVFPDVISLMASNLRSGITIDKAFLLSARPEFHPLDQEILKTGKDITTGQDIVYALKLMSERVNSERITRIIKLIISGLKAGGNISDLLEQTSRNMKEREVLEKRARSTISMYIIFIVFAVGVGAPILFGLSSILVEVIIALTLRLPEAGAMQTELPFTFNQISISLNFIIYFVVAFLLVSDLVTSLVLGLVKKGESKSGLRYFLPLALLSIALFFIVRLILSNILLETMLGSF
jgi:hypothetical protein